MSGVDLLVRVMVILVLGATATGGLLRSPIVEPYKSIAGAAIWLTAVFACTRLSGLL